MNPQSHFLSDTTGKKQQQSRWDFPSAFFTRFLHNKRHSWLWAIYLQSCTHNCKKVRRTFEIPIRQYREVLMQSWGPTNRRINLVETFPANQTSDSSTKPADLFTATPRTGVRTTPAAAADLPPLAALPLAAAVGAWAAAPPRYGTPCELVSPCAGCCCCCCCCCENAG